MLLYVCVSKFFLNLWNPNILFQIFSISPYNLKTLYKSIICNKEWAVNWRFIFLTFRHNILLLYFMLFFFFTLGSETILTETENKWFILLFCCCCFGDLVWFCFEQTQSEKERRISLPTVRHPSMADHYGRWSSQN